MLSLIEQLFRTLRVNKFVTLNLQIFLVAWVWQLTTHQLNNNQILGSHIIIANPRVVFFGYPKLSDNSFHNAIFVCIDYNLFEQTIQWYHRAELECLLIQLSRRETNFIFFYLNEMFSILYHDFPHVTWIFKLKNLFDTLNNSPIIFLILSPHARSLTCHFHKSHIWRQSCLSPRVLINYSNDIFQSVFPPVFTCRVVIYR